MCHPIFIPMAITAAAGTTEAIGQQQQGKAQAKMYQYQAQLAQQQADITRKYAEEQKKNIESAAAANIAATQGAAADESKRLFRQVSQLTGAQKAMMGALGIGGTTAEDIIGNTFDRAKLDELAIQYNANVRSWQIGEQAKRDIWTMSEESKFKSWALDSEAAQYGTAAKNARKAGNINTATTLLRTASQIAEMGVKSIPKDKEK